MEKFIMPEMQHEIINLKDYMGFKSKLYKDKELVCKIALDILHDLELEDLATYFTQQLNEILNEKIQYRKDHPLPEVKTQEPDTA